MTPHASLLLASLALAGAESPDAAAVARLFWTLEPGGYETVTPALEEAARAAVEQRVREAGLALGGAERAALTASTHDALARRLEDIPWGDRKARPVRLRSLAREVTSGKLAADAVDEWLGLAPPKPRRDPAPDSAAARALLRGQVSAEGSGELRLRTSEARLAAEAGPYDNEVLDVGEWALLRVEVENTSARPWFSTSATFVPDGQCLFTEPGVGYTVPELAPGARGAMELWLYFPRDCGAEPRRLRVTFRDTHNTPESTATLTLRPADVAGALRLEDVRLDTDPLGASDGSRQSPLQPGQRFELAAGLAGVPPSVGRATQSYRLPAVAGPLFSRFDFRQNAEMPLAEARLAAGDDLDAALVEPGAYPAAFRAAALALPSLGAGRLWVAIDAHLWVGARSRPAEKPAAPAPPPAARAVVDLVRKHLQLAPHLVAPAVPSSLAACGYECTFDEAGFSAAWEALLGVPKPAEAPLVEYVVRLYTPLPLAPPPTAAAPAAAPAPVTAPAQTAAPRPKASPPKPEEKLSPALVRIDAAAGWVSYATAAPKGDPNLWGGVSRADLVPLGLFVSAGRTVYGIAGATWGSASTPRVTVSELMFDAGAGYAFAWRFVEGGPQVKVSFRRRVADDAKFAESAESRSLGAAVGAVGRLRIGRWAGLWLTPEVVVHGDGPGVDEARILSGTGVRLLGGASLYLF